MNQEKIIITQFFISIFRSLLRQQGGKQKVYIHKMVEVHVLKMNFTH